LNGKKPGFVSDLESSELKKDGMPTFFNTLEVLKWKKKCVRNALRDSAHSSILSGVSETGFSPKILWQRLIAQLSLSGEGRNTAWFLACGVVEELQDVN
jgi:hypothetical protein